MCCQRAHWMDRRKLKRLKIECLYFSCTQVYCRFWASAKVRHPWLDSSMDIAQRRLNGSTGTHLFKLFKTHLNKKKKVKRRRKQWTVHHWVTPTLRTSPFWHRTLWPLIISHLRLFVWTFPVAHPAWEKCGPSSTRFILALMPTREEGGGLTSF